MAGAAAWGGREEEQRREDDKGNRELRLTSRQPCSGTPRVADGVDDRLAVHPRLAVRPHAKCSNTFTEVRSMARRPTRPFAQPKLSPSQPRRGKRRDGSQCAER